MRDTATMFSLQKAAALRICIFCVCTFCLAASGIVLTQTALYIPQYILAEVTLSFFGLGVSEPAPSWGNMLAELRQYFVLSLIGGCLLQRSR